MVANIVDIESGHSSLINFIETEMELRNRPNRAQNRHTMTDSDQFIKVIREGIAQNLAYEYYQQTLKDSLTITDYEFYGGNQVKLSIHPAEPNTGIFFKTPTGQVKASLENASTKMNAIFLQNNEASVLCVEHILATLYSYNIDNAVIDLERQPTKSFKLMQFLGLATETEVVPFFSELEHTLCNALDLVGTKKQSEKRKYITIDSPIDSDGKLIFTPTDSNDLVIKAITDYKVIGRQEKEMQITLEKYEVISSARRYAKHLVLPLPIVQLCASLYAPSFGVGHKFNEKNCFYPPKSTEEWKNSEIMDAEIAAHTIIDRLGALALLEGKLKGVHLTCQYSSHANDINILKQNYSKFQEVKEEL